MSTHFPLVVLTPVKNEAWILERFLRVCNDFADAIIIADQSSTDGSRDVIARYEPRVIAVYKRNGGQASALNAGFEV